MAVNGISALNAISPTLPETSKLNNNETSNINFADYLNNAIQNVNDLQIQSENIANDFAIGKTDNIHQVMIASEKADIALQFTMQIRNKILDAYNEIMRMQI